jgi:transcriptional regulator with AAA-type ATPase domain
MKSSDDTTLRLTDTTAAAARASLWLVWCGLGAAPPLRLLAGQSVQLGRGADGPGRLDFPGVSRQHAELFRQGPLFGVRDLGSTNGTFLNGQRIESAALSEGDVLRLGDAVAVVVTVSGDGPPVTSEPVKGVLFGPGLAGVLETVRRLASDSLPVVIEGATGVGKEGVARALHDLSGRKGPLHAVNCGALPVALAEAELFGYRKGAFTGAEQPGIGHVRAAEGGTLFLDELFDLAPPLQTKLLRVLQEKAVIPLGETRPIPVDVRIVAASLVPLSELVASRRLREDLAARLAGVSIVVPPLAARRADIPVLLGHFLRQYSGGRPPGVDGRLMEHLLLQPWAGNVRELELLARRLLALRGPEAVLRKSMLESPRPATLPPAPVAVRRRTSEDAEPDLQRLREHFAAHGNLSRAAQEAGISRQRAYRLLQGRSAGALVEGLESETAEGSGDTATTTGGPSPRASD